MLGMGREQFLGAVRIERVREEAKRSLVRTDVVQVSSRVAVDCESGNPHRIQDTGPQLIAGHQSAGSVQHNDDRDSLRGPLREAQLACDRYR